MSETVSRTVHNLLTLLAQQGDPKAIQALKNCKDVEIVDDIDDEDAVQIVVMQSDGEYLVTHHGTSFVPKNEEKE
ncbi:hypothetical protein [Microseira wollei]|uniref:Halobacterial output domain-containing protein n=1 Tax=Microseira wollei NIES-4236 TaxID=2530354 RepID=A0AAV3XQ68_9CYAN|nr:hypothetical protein [Microseira wollei]GET43031.1 hypothetical protein MiSe_78510 [Microseira wollei NIES-4236]